MAIYQHETRHELQYSIDPNDALTIAKVEREGYHLVTEEAPELPKVAAEVAVEKPEAKPKAKASTVRKRKPAAKK